MQYIWHNKYSYWQILEKIKQDLKRSTCKKWKQVTYNIYDVECIPKCLEFMHKTKLTFLTAILLSMIVMVMDKGRTRAT